MVQKNMYFLACMSNPQKTAKDPKNAKNGKTGYHGILKAGSVISFPSRGRKR